MPLVELQIVKPEAAPILSNLLELYCHDLSALFGLHVGPDGRFGYPHLPLYWTEPARRFAFFTVVDGQLAGFALATRGSSATANPSDLDVAEFFVLRAFREKGIGAQAAFLLWDKLIGHWVVRAATNNKAAVVFWRRSIAAYTAGAYLERTLELAGVTRQVFELDTRGGRREFS